VLKQVQDDKYVFGVTMRFQDDKPVVEG